MLRASVYVVGLMCCLRCLNFSEASEKHTCAFMMPSSHILMRGRSKMQVLSCRPNVSTSKRTQLRMTKEAFPEPTATLKSSGSENGVALPERNLQQESEWLQARV